MRGIRWITAIPLMYYLYRFLIWLNLKIVVFFYDKLTFMPQFLWELEYLIFNSVISIYVTLFVAYFYFPRDNFALVNNSKVKVFYWTLSAWTVIQLITFGVMISDAVKNYESGMIYQILYSPIAIGTVWIMYQAIAKVDYKHNQDCRDYMEGLQYQEYLDTQDRLEEEENRLKASN